MRGKRNISMSSHLQAVKNGVLDFVLSLKQETRVRYGWKMSIIPHSSCTLGPERVWRGRGPPNGHPVRWQWEAPYVWRSEVSFDVHGPVSQVWDAAHSCSSLVGFESGVCRPIVCK